ncbi:hypothetical protein [Gracilimonas sediminicola]|uniref:hypothetical protein n=1 Tax=Gracilimonas sediminicola TaxID=2952158 RepID=UPI0038D4B213
MEVPIELKKEMEQLSNKLDKAIEDYNEGNISKSEARKLSMGAGKRIKEFGNEIKEYNDKSK